MDAQYQRMNAVIEHVDAQWRQQPDLAASAAQAGLGPWRFQREFRLYALSNLRHGLIPGAVRQEKEAPTLRYGLHWSPLGRVLIVVSPRGLTELRFVDAAMARREQEAALQLRWPRATLLADRRATGAIARRILAGVAVPLALSGTPFQRRVWEALLRIPCGQTTSYGALAREVGAPGAARAVGTAVGANPLAVLIPCHRVIRASGALGGYRWGLLRKQLLLTIERLSV